MTILNWADSYYKPLSQVFIPKPNSPNKLQFDGIKIGDDIRIYLDEPLIIKGLPESISVDVLVNEVRQMETLSFNACKPQLAYYVFAITRRTRYMESYFPLVKSLTKAQRRQFHEMVCKLLLSPGFDLQMGGGDIVKVPATSYLVAGHIVEVFFYRPDILDLLMQGKLHIWLHKDGGVGGLKGCYDPKEGCVNLSLRALFSPFNQPTPWFSRFLFGFAHLLNHFDCLKLDQSSKAFGWLPGMRLPNELSPSPDGDIYTPGVRRAFNKGKQLEISCYQDLIQIGHLGALPLGQPHIFGDNREFLAGYFEMFFRKPHKFAATNPDLYKAFSMLLRQDLHQYWADYCPTYVEQADELYNNGRLPPPHGLTIEPEDDGDNSHEVL